MVKLRATGTVRLGGGAGLLAFGEGASKRCILACVFSRNILLFLLGLSSGGIVALGIAATTLGRATAATWDLVGGTAFLAVGRVFPAPANSSSGEREGVAACKKYQHGCTMHGDLT